MMNGMMWSTITATMDSKIEKHHLANLINQPYDHQCQYTSFHNATTESDI